MIQVKTLPSEILWYAIGLIATDGNLSSDKRHITITSKDIDYLIELRDALGLKNKISRKARSYEGDKKYGHFSFGDVAFYKFLLSLGLTPKKSLTLGALKIPKMHFKDFLRGVIDGDGNIRGWIHPTNKLEQWELRIYSAAPSFAQWLQLFIEKYFQVTGTIIIHKPKDKNPMYILKFGKMAARAILGKVYYENAFSLKRKEVLAKACLKSYVGWKRSLTILA